MREWATSWMYPLLEHIPAEMLKITKTLPKSMGDDAIMQPILNLWKANDDMSDAIQFPALGTCIESLIEFILARHGGWGVYKSSIDLHGIDMILYKLDKHGKRRYLNIQIRKPKYTLRRNNFEGSIVRIVGGKERPISSSEVDLIIYVMPYFIFSDNCFFPVLYIIPVKDIEAVGLKDKIIMCPHRDPSPQSLAQSKLDIESYFCAYDLLEKYFRADNDATTSRVFDEIILG